MFAKPHRRYEQGEDEIDFLKIYKQRCRASVMRPEFLISEHTVKSYREKGSSKIQKRVLLANLRGQPSRTKEENEFLILTAYEWGPDQWFWTMHRGRRVVVKSCPGTHHGSCYKIFNLESNRTEADVVAYGVRIDCQANLLQSADLSQIPSQTQRGDTQASGSLMKQQGNRENVPISARGRGRNPFLGLYQNQEDDDGSSSDSSFPRMIYLMV